MAMTNNTRRSRTNQHAWVSALLLGVVGCSDSPAAVQDIDTPVEATDAGAPGDEDSDAGSEESPPDPVPPARTLHIQFDYSLDDSGFFAMPERRKALEEAAALWTKRLVDDFPARPAGRSVVIYDPEAINDEELLEIELTEPIDDLRIYVGCTTMEGTKLGAARGVKSIMSFDPDGNPVPNADGDRLASANFEPWVSTIAFDCTNPWSLTETPPGDDDDDPDDFIVTAAHEIGHVLGVSNTAPAFAAYVENDLFDGTNAVDAFGRAVPVDGSHLDLSPSSYLMAPGGHVRRVSEVEFGILEDIGYEVVPK
jgi:hypothetical protein